MDNVLITPHVAISGTPYREKLEDVLLENCRSWLFSGCSCLARLPLAR